MSFGVQYEEKHVIYIYRYVLIRCTIYILLVPSILGAKWLLKKHVNSPSLRVFHWHPDWRLLVQICFASIMAIQPTPPGHVPPPRNQGLIAGLIKGNQWVFISPDHKAGYFCVGGLVDDRHSSNTLHHGFHAQIGTFSAAVRPE